MTNGMAPRSAAPEFRPAPLMTREPNYHYAPDSIHLEFAPTMIGRAVEIHLAGSVIVGKLVTYYVTIDGRSHVELDTTVTHEDGAVMHLGPQTFVVVMVH